ncbi:MAG: MBL fold metallo-hydrolase [Planctomycetia bacterium]|nr:MBL fold metallo-hydrolase [Planctomycetia bacterium]
MINLAGTLTALVALLGAETHAAWRELAPGVWHQDSQPAAYLLVDGAEALVVGAPADLDLAALEARLRCRADTILLTHAHRDTTASAARLVGERRLVRAAKLSEPWLSPAGVARHWSASLPEPIPAPPLTHRRWGKWQYFVPGIGVEGVRFDLADGDVVRCGKWSVTVVATPGHAPDHTSYLAVHDDRPGRIVFCGDAFSREGKLWTPFTTDWHHQNADGLNAAAESLRRIAALGPTLLCPEHGEPVSERIDAQLATTAQAVRRAAIAKGYDTFLREQGRAVPLPKFLAPEQVGSANADGNTKPWTKLSPSLFLTGNTYAIASRDGPTLLVDPYHRELQHRIVELRRDHNLHPVEALLISHAHNDHYTGVFYFAPGTLPAVWTLDRIADVIERPDTYRAPYVDPRPVSIARRLKDGETIAWHEHRLRIHHQPGQTDFAMGIEAEIDGRKVLFTGDNFYRADQYSGSGGWSGHNRGLPAGYVYTLERIIALKPDWILAEHGGALEYSPVDFAARLDWAREAAASADALSPSGDHRRDWNPHAIRFEPAIVGTRPYEGSDDITLVAEGSLADAKELWIRVAVNGVLTAPRETQLVPMRAGRGSIRLKIRSDVMPPRFEFVAIEVGRVGEPALAIDCVLPVFAGR